MPRLIDATEVVKAILAEREKIPRTIYAAPYELGIEKPYHAGDQMRGGIRKALRCVEQAPTVDAVPVVRCRECKYKNKKKCPMIMIQFGRNGKELLVQNHVSDDFFCGDGERKEGAD